jgi:hypothetical protein
MRPRTVTRRRRLAIACGPDEPQLSCGSGPLARYLYMGRLLARGTIRLATRARRRERPMA